MSSPVSYDLQGQGGGVVIEAGDSVVFGNFRWIQVIEETVLTGIVSTNILNAINLTGKTLSAGLGIGGSFTSIEVGTGVVIAYYA